MSRRVLGIGIFSALMLFVPILVMAMLLGESLISGVYAYDPRTTAPSQLIVRVPPEQQLRAQLQQQIARDGTYPQHTAADVVLFEPTWVNIDLRDGGLARVDVRLRYTDGTAQIETFSLPALQRSAIALPLLPATSFRIVYGPPRECQPTAAHVSVCAPGS